jgi:hypothetical protein
MEIYQNMELAKNGEIAEKSSYIQELLQNVRAPITGYALQAGGSTGLYPEGWARGRVQLRIRPQQPVKRLVVKGWRPESAPPSASIAVKAGEQSASVVRVGRDAFEIPVSFDSSPEEYDLSIECDVEFQAPGMPARSPTF